MAREGVVDTRRRLAVACNVESPDTSTNNKRAPAVLPKGDEGQVS